MTRAVTRIARGATSGKKASTNVVLVRGRLVAPPTIRLVGRRERVASFDLASIVQEKRVVVPVTAGAEALPTMKEGDDVMVLGHVRRRFFRVGVRTQSITEIVAEHVSVGTRSAGFEKVLSALADRARETRATTLPRVD